MDYRQTGSYSCLSRGEWDDLRFELAVLVHRQQPHRHRQLKPSRPARARIEVEHALAFVEVRHMRVAEEHGAKLPGCWVQVQRVQVVEHVDVAAIEKQDIGFRKFTAWAFAVHVPPNRGHRGDLGQLLQNRRLAHIAEVQDALDSGQRRRNLRPQQAMGIADHADSHLQPQFQPCARVELVAHRVAQEVESQHSARNSRGREEHKVRRIEQMQARVVEH